MAEGARGNVAQLLQGGNQQARPGAYFGDQQQAFVTGIDQQTPALVGLRHQAEAYVAGSAQVPYSQRVWGTTEPTPFSSDPNQPTLG